MLRVGLSGGIGSGKSTVARRLAEHGAVIVDADLLAREVVEPGTDGLAEIVAAFGEDVLDASGALNRAALAARVFTDDEARRTLNGIVHPRVGARTAEIMAAAPEEAVVVHDVPLLVENGLAPAYHLVLIVHADQEERVRRLVESRGMPEADARARIASQAGDDQRRAVADVWLDNSGTQDEVHAVVDALWADRLVSYEANVRLRRASPPVDPRVVPSDETWPAQADRIVARLAAATGHRAEHIGSTAVPGLAAEDVIDLQLSAEADAGALAGAGFFGGDGVFDSADPGRPARVLLRREGSSEWVTALLLRDWLCAEAEARAEYEEFKLRVATEHVADGGTGGYADAKRPWFDEAVPRARSWHTGRG
jgi:dephospho-CoA kinase